MTLGIKIGEEFLDLPKGTMLELESENPFLQFNESIKGSYSLPFQVEATEKNLRLLNYSAIIQKKIDNTGIDALIYQNGLQHSRGKIKIENSTINLNKISSGKISCYYLTGSSDFFQDIKGKKLKDINVGGVRSFAWDGLSTLTGPGFWGHLHDVINDLAGPVDYSFFPVVNKDWIGVRTQAEVMNLVIYDAGMVKVMPFTKIPPDNNTDANVIVPFPRLEYVLRKAAEHVGWSMDGDILNDLAFKKTVLINFQSIDWARKTGPISSPNYVFMDPVVFNLQDHLPDVSIAEFLIALKNRFGWWYDFDFVRKKITIKSIGDMLFAQIKDMTDKSSAIVTKKIIQDKKIYSFVNDFSTSLGNGKPSWDSVKFQGAVATINDLPAPADANYAYVYLVAADNNYYICNLDDNGNLVWQFYTYNIYDYEPQDANEEIRTSATTVGVEVYDNYLDLVPRIDHKGNWLGRSEMDIDAGIILCFYHGLRDNKNGDPYPYGSAHIYDSAGQQVSPWGLTFECKKNDGTDVGLYELNWKKPLNVLKGSEEMEVTLVLPYYEYLQLRFSDRIIIDGVMMFVKKINAKIPYQGSVSIEAVRLF